MIKSGFFRLGGKTGEYLENFQFLTGNIFKIVINYMVEMPIIGIGRLL